MHRPAKSEFAGFTLVEIAIVLIIIGLLTAVIVTGKTLIKAAEVRAEIGQIAQMNAAVNAFKGKYNCLPGDCRNAYAFGFGHSSADNGDGNGKIGAGTNMDDQESVNFWYHLSAAGLIPGSYPVYAGGLPGTHLPGIASPPLAMSGSANNYLVGGGSAANNVRGGLWLVGNYRWLAFLLTRAQHAWIMTASTAIGTWLPVYTAVEVYAIDSKLDDGLPMTGNVQAFDSYYETGLMLNYPTSTGHPESCVNDGVSPAVYNLNQGNYSSLLYARCSPIIEAKF